MKKIYLAALSLVLAASSWAQYIEPRMEIKPSACFGNVATDFFYSEYGGNSYGIEMADGSVRPYTFFHNTGLNMYGFDIIRYTGPDPMMDYVYENYYGGSSIIGDYTYNGCTITVGWKKLNKSITYTPAQCKGYESYLEIYTQYGVAPFTITVKDGSGSVYQTQTNASGMMVLQNLPEDTYSITISDSETPSTTYTESVTILPEPTRPPAPTGDANQYFNQGATAAQLVTSASYVRWYTSSFAYVAPSTQLIDGATYTGYQYVNGCPSEPIYVTAHISTILPVKWLSFTGKINNTATTLNWKVQEANVANYTVQQSTDAIHFADAKTFGSKGDGTNVYAATVPNAASGAQYFRIKQTDKDGKISYSETIKLSVVDKALVMYPNPAKDVLNIKANEILNGSIFSIDGRKVMEVKLNNGTNKINVKQLVSGTYYLMLSNGEKEMFIIK